MVTAVNTMSYRVFQGAESIAAGVGVDGSCVAQERREYNEIYMSEFIQEGNSTCGRMKSLRRTGRSFNSHITFHTPKRRSTASAEDF